MAWVAVRVSVTESPAVIELRLATIITVAAGWVTVTAVDADAVPPGPLTLATYVVFAAGLTVSVPPLAESL